jgi:pyridoxamine 5'-phosphate oxidase
MPNKGDKVSIEGLRRNYTYGSLVRSELPLEPIPFFKQWFAQLQSESLPEWFEVNAMTLSTTDGNGAASSRIVLLKQLDPDGFVFFTNYDSAKGMDIAGQPNVALHFFWPMFERQVRIQGTASKTADSLSDSYFASRPRLSQLGAAASPQSQVVVHDSELELALAELDKRYAGQEVPRPQNWGGYKVVPHAMEFWQGRPSRLHDRFRYRLVPNSSQWIIERLAP